MTPAETIQAAIDKLEWLRGAASAGRWTSSPDLTYPGERIIDSLDGLIFDPGDYAASSATTSAANSDLIVTLHATIDAQLAILREAHETAQEIAAIGFGSALGRNRAGYNLARAILGEDA